MKTVIQYLKSIPTVICINSTKRNKNGEIRKLALTHYEKNKWRATYLLDDVGDREEWTENGVFLKDVPIVDGHGLLSVLAKLNNKVGKLKIK